MNSLSGRHPGSTRIEQPQAATIVCGGAHARNAAVIAGAFLVCAALVWVAGCGGSGNSTNVSTASETGVSYETAIKVGSIGEQLDIMNGTPCGEGGFFRKTHVEVVALDERHFDIVDAACTSGGSYRRFYFDVSSCFPCPD